MNVKELTVKSLLERGSMEVAGKGISINLSASDQKREHYLGMSMIGHCPRKLWIEYKIPEEINGIDVVIDKDFQGNVLRIFRLGHILEEEMVFWLKTAGGDDIVSGTQDEFRDFNDQFRGHCDGVLDLGVDDKYVLEIKTMNKKKFTEFEKNGIRYSHYPYYCQINLYMYYLDLSEGFLVSYCKDNSKFHVELVKRNDELINHLRWKANNILIARNINEVFCNKSEQECYWCSYANICNTLPEKIGC